MRSLRLITFAIFTLILAACAGEGTPTAYFIPPTSKPEAAIPAGQTINTSVPDLVETEVLSTTPTTTPACTPNLLYLEDLSIPDGTVVEPGKLIDKRWLVENNGSCNWEQGYSLTLLAGPELGAPVEQALYPARSGTQATVRILFTAPEEEGNYRSAWQAKDSKGNLFGDPIYVDIIVESP